MEAVRSDMFDVDIPKRIRNRIAKVFEHYDYAGKLYDAQFLSHFYDLDKLSSNDPRFKTAKEDIVKHTCDMNEGDWAPNWVFSDKRFGLNSCSSSSYIEFLLYIFDVDVRDDGWLACMNEINAELHECGAEFYEKDIEYGESIIGIRLFDKLIPARPFSMRYVGDASKSLASMVTPQLRQKLFTAIEPCEAFFSTSDTSFPPYHQTSVFSECIKRLHKLGIVDFQSADMSYVIMNCRPEVVFDIIEMCFDEHNATIRDEINLCLRDHNIPLKLLTREFTWSNPKAFGVVEAAIPSDFVFLAAYESIRKVADRFAAGDFSAMVLHAVTAIDSILKVMAEEKKITIVKRQSITALFGNVLRSYGMTVNGQDEVCRNIVSQGCQLVESLANLRNKKNDAHGNVGPLPVYRREQAALVRDISISICNYLCRVYLMEIAEKEEIADIG